MKNMRHEMRMSIRLERSEASEGCGAQEHVGYKQHESTQDTKDVK